MFVNAVVALALFAGAVSAQTNASYVDPNSVTPTLKASWCNGQQNVCKTLCDGNAKTNGCDPTTLKYNCTCQSNGSAPALELYMNSLPFYICTESYGQCIKLHPDDQLGQDNCTTNIKDKCGKLDVANYTAAAPTSGASASASATGAASATDAGTGSATAATPSATKSSAGVAIRVGSEYGSGIIAAGIVAAFALLL